MDLLTFVSNVLLYSLGAASLFVINTRVAAFQKKLQDSRADALHVELVEIKKRMSELSIKVGLKDSFK